MAWSGTASSRRSTPPISRFARLLEDAPMHASTLMHGPGARHPGGAVAAKRASVPREAANDVARPGAPAAITRPVVRLTPEEQRRELKRAELRGWLARLFAPVLGLVLFGLLWQLVAHTSGQLPTPAKVWQAAITLFSDPFYQKGPNDQGIGWNVLSSLKRVGMGFGLAALVGIPLGFVIGRFPFFNQMAAPLISLLKPVSPLAWLPIGLLLFKAANPAALPFMLTGVRLSIGIAWLVIVAAEMLTGGVGIGFWVWDEWNNLNVQHIIIAIVVIGVVGLLLEAALILIARRFEYQ